MDAFVCNAADCRKIAFADAAAVVKQRTVDPVRRNSTKTDRAFFDQKLYYHHTHTAGQYPAVYP